MVHVTLHPGDNRATLRRLIDQGVRVHSVVSDPPYGLVSITRRFGKDGAAPALSKGATGVFGRASAGFMGSQWDGTGIERDPEFWRLIWEILLPGGFCLAFSGARTGHWQACAMEQAGFVMHPMTGWVFGSGFPKAHDAAKAIDKMLGAKGAVLPTGSPVRRMVPGATQNATGQWEKPGPNEGGREYQPGDYDPATAAAAAWQGWAYGAQTLKPALEPIYIGQKPFSEKTGAGNLLVHGVGAMNIDGCRVGDEELSYRTTSYRDASTGEFSSQGQTNFTTGHKDVTGRHPANLLHDGSEAVRALFPDSAGQIARVSTSDDTSKTRSCYGAMKRGNDNPAEPRADADSSAARFFNAFPLGDEDRWFVAADDYSTLTDAGLIDDPAALALYYHAKANTRDRVFQCQACGAHGVGAKPACNCPDRTLRSHPTVKPVALMRHLVRLVTPPGGTVLDPFAGTGTTGAAARSEGFDCILMEADPNYCRDIEARLGLCSGSILNNSDTPDQDRPDTGHILSGDSEFTALSPLESLLVM